jgi:hypothetical protein
MSQCCWKDDGPVLVEELLVPELVEVALLLDELSVAVLEAVEHGGPVVNVFVNVAVMNTVDV